MLEAAAGRGPGELRTIHVPETAVGARVDRVVADATGLSRSW